MFLKLVLFLDDSSHVIPGFGLHDKLHKAFVFQVQHGLLTDLISKSVVFATAQDRRC